MTEFTRTSPAPSTTRRRLARGGAGVVLVLSLGLGLPAVAQAAPSDGGLPMSITTLAASRPGNGAVLTRRGSGAGEFTADNQAGSTDAVVTLARGSQATLVLYVRAGASATATKVPDGTYDVFVQRGTNWDSGARHFADGAGYGKFDKQADFATQRTSRGVRYSIVTVTLQEVPGGNTTENPVAENAIPA